MRGVTASGDRRPREDQISTRTPHAGSDTNDDAIDEYREFQPALPMRGVTRPR